MVDANRPVIRPIQVTGLDTELALYHTVDEALKPTSRLANGGTTVFRTGTAEQAACAQPIPSAHRPVLG